MIDEITTLLERVSMEAGLQFGLVRKSDFDEKASCLTAFKKQLAYSALNAEESPVDAIYFSGENPFFQFKFLTDFNFAEIASLHRKLWNEGRTPVVGIITPQEIRLYDGFDCPASQEAELQTLERGRFQNTESDIQRFGLLLHQSKIDSGQIWKEAFGLSIKTQNRVDRKLVNNLATARARLSSEFQVPFDIVHDLLGRSLFTLYLEDRGILTPEHYPSKPVGVSDFFDLLSHPSSVYKLFNKLKVKFNGDIFPVTVREERLVCSKPQCLDIIRRCFLDVSLTTGQLSFWRMFQFQHIPIELISAIYEEFMSEEDEDHVNIKKDGAFYTPQMLVEFVLNEVLPWPDEHHKNYDLRIIDPACGSGIFLVESYKRLIARWKYAHQGKDIDENVLETLLHNNIFGIEKDPEAIKVTAFSLYLTFLNYVEPKKVLSQVKFKPLVCWKSKKELNQRKRKKSGNNLYQYSTFAKGLPLSEQKFDLVIGNPPWRLGKLDADVKEYLNRNGLPQQIMCAYLDLMPDLVTDGVIALISAAKLLFNTGKLYDEFRRNFFIKNNVEAIINLAVVRDIVFKNATSPGAVIIYRKNCADDNSRKDYVTYCVPKSIEVIKHRQAIVIDASEVKFLPLRDIIKENTKVFKIAMWGNVRDLRLIDRLKNIPSISDRISKNEWGVGLKIKGTSPAGNKRLADYPFLPTQEINQYYTGTRNKTVLGDRHRTFRTNSKNIFDAPIVLVKEGSHGGEFCCSYLDSNTAFLSSALGISIKGKDRKFHKALVACLNSSLATYYYFITSSSWGIDKGGRVQNNDALSFPALPYLMSKEDINQLADKIDQIRNIRSSTTLQMNEAEQIDQIKGEIDDIIYSNLAFTQIERALVNDVLGFSVSLNKRYIASCADGIPTVENNLKPYSKTLGQTINAVLKQKKKSVTIELLSSESNRDPFRLVAIHFGINPEQSQPEVATYSNLSNLIQTINKHSYEQHSESFYYRKVIKYYTGGSIYMVKPNQKRFWTISQALNDADGILLDLVHK